MCVLHDKKDLKNKNILNDIFFSMIVHIKHINWRTNSKSFFAANQARQNTVRRQGSLDAGCDGTLLRLRMRFKIAFTFARKLPSVN